MRRPRWFWVYKYTVLGFGVLGLGYTVWGLGFWRLGFRVYGLGFRV